MKLSKFKIFSSIIFLMFFGIFNLTQASTYYSIYGSVGDETTSSTNQTLPNFSVSSNQYLESFEYLYSWQTYGGSYPPEYHWELWNADSNVMVASTSISTWGNSLTPAYKTLTYANFQKSNPITLIANTNYYFKNVIDDAKGYGNFYLRNSSYPNYYFKLTFSTSASTAVITYPVNALDGVPQFSHFSGTYYSNGSTLENIAVRLGTSPTNWVATSTAYMISNGQGIWSAQNNYLLQPNTLYYARPYILDFNTGEILYTGSQIIFGTGGNLQPYEINTNQSVNIGTTTVPTYPSLTTNFSGFATTTCPAFDFFASTTMNTLFCLTSNFIANSANSGLAVASSSFGYLGELTQTTFPLSGLYIINQSINQVQSATSSPDITLGGLGSSGNPTFGGKVYVLLSDAMTAEIASKINFDFKSWLDQFMYLMTGVIITLLSYKTIIGLNKVKNIQ